MSQNSNRIPNKTTTRQAIAQIQPVLTQALLFHDKGQLGQAKVLYEQVLKMDSNNFSALHFLGIIAAQTNNFEHAVELISRAIKYKPQMEGAHYNLGKALSSIHQHQAAIDSYDKAIALNPDYAEAYYNRGNAQRALNQQDAAIQSYNQTIAIMPDHVNAYNNRGNVLRDLKLYDAAIQNYDRAIALNPDYVDAYNNRGNVLKDLKQQESAIKSYDQAIALKPDYVDGYYNRGVALGELHQYQAAIDNFDQAIMLNSSFAEAYFQRGNTLSALNAHDEAIQSYEQAIALKPDYVDALHNLGVTQKNIKNPQEALESFDRVIALSPDYPYLYGTRLNTKMHICDWNNLENQCAHLAIKIEQNEKASHPFTLLGVTSSLALQRKATEIWVKDHPIHSCLEMPKHHRYDKIRIGYFSADFRYHPVSLLTAELFEKHDRTKFELTAFSFNPYKEDNMTKRIEFAFDNFINVKDLSDASVVELSRNIGIDIAIDLGGFTKDNRSGIFAMRAAPIQVSYLGYLGTMAADYIDYLIADPIIIPEKEKHHYLEKIVYLPSYQVNDSTRHISNKKLTREELGLPKTGFIFCCFNHNYKIMPSTFDSWMSILKGVEKSILFLYADNNLAAINLKKEAALRDVDPDRLYFGKRLPVSEYLDRYRVADLFLDTLPYNAGTTASDALWAGLPVITCIDESFASRMAASLLHAINLPDLITSTKEDYKALAIELATNPKKLAKIKKRLENNRLTTSLFDTELFTKNIEASYIEMFERSHSGLPPDHIYVENC